MQEQLNLAIAGMHCEGCVRRVTAALAKVQGAEVEQVEVGSARVNFDTEKASKEKLIDAVNRIGFNARQA
ncbi:MAG: heavy-metal-associated domain-containing protein [Bryobacteraceae bacterium]|jgi:copper chaperone CopZ